MRHAGAGAGEKGDFAGVERGAVRVPDMVPDPAEPFGIVARPAAESLEREGDVFGVLGQVRVQAHALVGGEQGGVAHELARHREGRAGRDTDADHRAFGRIVEGVDHPDAVLQDIGLALHQAVGRQAAGAFADAHCAARRMEAQAYRGGGLDRVFQPHAVGIDIKVVRTHPAAGERKLGQAELRGDEHVLGPHPRPDGIERLQPAEQQRVLPGRHGARQRLVEMVMGIDERRRHHAAGGVDDLPVGRVFRAARAHAADASAFHENVGVGRLAAVPVHRDDDVCVADPEFPVGQRIAPQPRSRFSS